MHSQLQPDYLLVAIEEVCRGARLCKISTVSELVGLEAPELVDALAPAVAQRQLFVLGAPKPTGFLWLTAAGVKAARQLREISSQSSVASRQ